MAELAEEQPSQSLPHKYEDITDFLKEVAPGMEIGQMIHSESFDLHESISALELMDAKMDAGINPGQVMSYERALKEGKLSKEMTAHETLALMDGCMALEATWHAGHSIVDTLVPCLYLHKPVLAADSLAQRFIVSFLHSCSLARNLVVKGDVFEEEDFVPPLFGFELAPHVEPEAAAADLDGAMSVLLAQIQQAKQNKQAAPQQSNPEVQNQAQTSSTGGWSKGGVKKKKKKHKGKETGGPGNVLTGQAEIKAAAGPVPPLQEDPAMELPLAQALLARLKYRKALSKLFQALLLPDAQALPSLASLVAHAQLCLGQVRDSLPLGYHPQHATPLEPPQPKLLSPEEALQGAKAEPQGEAKESKYPAPPGFYASVGRNFISGVPPRQVTLKTREEAIEEMERFLEHVGLYSSLLPLRGYQELLEKFFSLSARRPSILARSSLMVLLHSEANLLGKGPCTELLRKAMHAFCSSSERFTSSPDFKQHVHRLQTPVCMLFRLLCENRSRQRRRIGAALSDWAIMEAEADYLDQVHLRQLQQAGVDLSKQPTQATPYRYPFSAFVYDQTIGLLSYYLELGFELNLYADMELPVMYWSMEHLYDARLRNRLLAYRPNEAQLRKAQTLKDNEARFKLLQASPPSAAVVLIDAFVNLCRALVYAIQGIKSLGVTVLQVPDDYADVWFLNRFSDLHRVPQPPHRTMDHYRHQMAEFANGEQDHLATSRQFFTNALKKLQLAYTHPQGPSEEDKKKIKELQQVCVLNGMLETNMAKQLKGHSSSEFTLTYSFERHHLFPVLALEKRKQTPICSAATPYRFSLHPPQTSFGQARTASAPSRTGTDDGKSSPSLPSPVDTSTGGAAASTATVAGSSQANSWTQ
eukprot:g2255.t1